MTAEEFLSVVNERDEMIARLREYAQSLESLLADKRGEDARNTAYSRAWDDEISQLRYKLGLRSDLTIR